jgi:hypothetical protein
MGEPFMALTRKLVLALLLGMGTLSLAACEEQEGPAERAGESVDNATERAGEALENAGEKVQQQAH